MKNYDKYQKGYFLPPKQSFKWVEKDYIEKAPIWCSVDLRDGNQALIVPMSLEQKIDLFKFLVKLGFEEIEVGFPAASETEFIFLRTLIEQNLIPDDVTVQVLTQARDHIIAKTFEALKGAKSAIVHFYNSTSVAQREQVFKKSKSEIIDIAKNGANALKKLAEETEGNFRFEYSPESFTGTEPEFALEICNEVLDILKPSKDNKVIINLPSTVQVAMPHVYAGQVEYMSDNLKYRENVILSVHPHNDRGSGVCDAEMGILAGADRVEGTLFGNGERTGNVDIITLAMNMFSQGVDPQLNFENMSEIIEEYEKATGMTVDPRSPYSGQLVFTAFSGSHQDAIAKGMNCRETSGKDNWDVPYLIIDPKHIGRNYDGDVIRINSQSGKGGIGYLLEQKYGYNLPAKMREDLGYIVKGVSDHTHKELMPDDVYQIFKSTYVNQSDKINLNDVEFSKDGKTVTCVFETDGKTQNIEGTGNGRLDAISTAVQTLMGVKFSDFAYTEHALERGSKSKAACYVGVMIKQKTVWGVGVDEDIFTASIKALISAVNRGV